MLHRYKKYKCPDAKRAMDILDSNWIKEDVSLNDIDHLYEWINIVEDIFNLLNRQRWTMQK